MPANVGGLRPSDYDACKAILRANGLPLNRSYYYRALDIALRILSNQGIALQEEGSDVLLETFIIDFDELFEEYVRSVLQQRADADPDGHLFVKDGNREGKKPLFDDRPDPSAQPDIVFGWRNGETIVAEVKYKERPLREDINQAVTYALSYRTNRAILVHQCVKQAQKGLRRIGIIQGIGIDAYGFDLAAADLHAEETAFTQCLFNLVRPSQGVGVAA
jgi:5-methylcytosine-specific restriction enzyme subunit McrC